MEFGGGVVVGFGFGGRRGPVSFRAVKLFVVAVVLSVFVFARGKGGESALEVWWWCCRFLVLGGARGPVSFRTVKLFVVAVVLSVFCFGAGGGPVSFRAVKGKGGESALEFGGGVVVGFCFGGRRGPVSFRAVKLFVVAVVLSVFCFGAGGGPVSFRAVKGKGGESALEFGGGVVVGFLFWGAQGASQLPGCETVRRRRRAVCFCFGAGGGPVSFRAVKGKGGESALEFGGGVVVGFCFGGRRGPVSFRAVKGKGGESALELSCSAGNGGESASGL